MSFSGNIEDHIVSTLYDELESGNLVLPSLPDVAIKVQAAINDRNVTSAKVAAVIETDVALAARLIQISNSPLIRSSKKIGSVDTAVTRMGNTMVNTVVTSLTLQQIFKPATKVIEKRLAVFWDHSNYVAALSQNMAPDVGLKSDKALLAGLIHDIGALPVLKQAENIPILLEDAELLDKVISNTHGAIGKAMLEEWGFPDELVHVPVSHEILDREHDGPADYVDLVTVANLQSYQDSAHRHAAVEWSTVPAFAKLELDTDKNTNAESDQSGSIDDVLDALLM